jgi:creatinine amidohydrolase/Fe(II)-dependent formamide hydrolase-like protein
MAGVDLYTLSWPEVKREIEAGRDTIVFALGAVEQHGHHLPLGTDSMLGDEVSRAVAERLDAFHAPTMRVGCSGHHLAFPGTMSVEQESFEALVGDVVRGWARHGFARIVLIPTHGGNFGPLRAAVERLAPVEGVTVIAVDDLTLLVEATIGVGEKLGIAPSEAGAHGGEAETSMMLALYPEFVDMDRALPGYTGDLSEGIMRLFTEGIETLSETGVFGDPRRASAHNGRKYLERFVDLTVELVERRS